ncbi:MAG: hypothetical protein IIA51_05205 [Chloroflexi bacterium]|nr:hypothetical protein [Chloroflexota bacterium]
MNFRSNQAASPLASPKGPLRENTLRVEPAAALPDRIIFQLSRHPRPALQALHH